MEAACLKNEDQLPLQLIFQDEARFGRISDPRSCWAPAPHRPVVHLALVREFRYEYAAVSPWDGSLDFMTAEKMNTETMSRFLEQVSQAHQDQFIVMVVQSNLRKVIARGSVFCTHCGHTFPSPWAGSFR